MNEKVRRPRQLIFKTTILFFFVGVLLAIALEALWGMAGYGPSGYAVERVSRVLWPSSIFKMVLDSSTDSASLVALVYALSFAANGALYGFFGFLVGLARKASSPPQ